jgi:hypothetical protein
LNLGLLILLLTKDVPHTALGVLELEILLLPKQLGLQMCTTMLKITRHSRFLLTSILENLACGPPGGARPFAATLNPGLQWCPSSRATRGSSRPRPCLRESWTNVGQLLPCPRRVALLRGPQPRCIGGGLPHTNIFKQAIQAR